MVTVAPDFHIFPFSRSLIGLFVLVHFPFRTFQTECSHGNLLELHASTAVEMNNQKASCIDKLRR